VKFIISKRARRHIEKIQAWWVENRTSAPALFLDELAGAERRLRTKPTLGLVYTAHKSGVVRKVLLTKTNHHLDYRYLPERDELTVLAVWGAPRERGPKL
jgi:plasmid stabilization system protein ParE